MSRTISIITPWLDHPEFIADYESATRAPDVEVIVVDNASNAANAKAIHDMVGRLGGKYLRNEENHWFAPANNQGLAVSTGQIVVFLNNDVSGSSAWLENVRHDVQAGALYGPELCEREFEGKRFAYLSGWCIAARRQTWEMLGGWDAARHSMPYWEDTDLGYRATQAGLKLKVSKWPIHHKGNGTSSSVPGVVTGEARMREVFLSRIQGNAQSAPAVDETSTDFESAVALLHDRRLPEAERAFARAIARNPNRADMWMQYCDVLYLSGRKDAAIEAVGKAIALNPGDAKLYVNLGTLLGSTGRKSEAVNAFRQAIAIAPQMPEAHNSLSRVLLETGQIDEAIAEAQEAVKLNPGFPPGLVNLSHALRAAGRNQEALNYGQLAVKASPNYAAAHNCVGAALAALGDLAGALASFEQALRISPHDLMATQSRLQIIELMNAGRSSPTASGPANAQPRPH